MTQPNIPQTKHASPRFHWVAWFPYPSSWLKSLILTVFLSIVIIIVKFIGKTGVYLSAIIGSPEMCVFFVILALLSPIPAIAEAHHIIHLLVARFYPKIQAPEIGKPRGLVPGLISWWEGLYGWVVIVLSTLTATVFCSIFLPFLSLSYEKVANEYNQSAQTIQALFAIVWMINAALIYQFEYLVKRRIISVNIDKIDRGELNLTSKDVDLNQLRGEMGIHEMKLRRNMKKKS